MLTNISRKRRKYSLGTGTLSIHQRLVITSYYSTIPKLRELLKNVRGVCVGSVFIITKCSL